MADPSKINRPLTRDSVRKAHELIKPYIHLTPVLTCDTLSDLASTPQSPAALAGTEFEGQTPAQPRIKLFFKCENYQKIGAFKARGAFHALARLTDGQLEDGVITHSSGNHAQALALAAKTRNIPAYIVMPTISTPSKIAATKGYGAQVHFSGSTSDEREAMVADLQAKTGARLVPPYDHPDIILGQGTMALEFEQQVKEMVEVQRSGDKEHEGFGWRSRRAKREREEKGRREGQKAQQDGEVHMADGAHSNGTTHAYLDEDASEGLDAVIAPLGGGGMLSGIATALSGTGTYVFGAEPSFEGGDDGRRGLAATPPMRIPKVKTLTIADGLRTPVGIIPWSVISDKEKVRGVYGVSEEQIKSAMRLLLERMKVMVEPSAAVGLAVALYDEGFRRIVEREGGVNGWNVGIILSGGNTTVEAIGKLFSEDAKKVVDGGEEKGEREEGKVGMDGARVAENVAG